MTDLRGVRSASPSRGIGPSSPDDDPQKVFVDEVVLSGLSETTDLFDEFHEAKHDASAAKHNHRTYGTATPSVALYVRLGEIVVVSEVEGGAASAIVPPPIAAEATSSREAIDHIVGVLRKKHPKRFGKVNEDYFRERLEKYLETHSAPKDEELEIDTSFFHSSVSIKVSGQEIYRETTTDGKIKRGKFQYIPELRGVCLVEGEVKFPDGYVETGKRAYIPELRGVCLVDGEIKYLSGDVRRGKFQYIPGLKGVCLVDGEAKFPDGRVEIGKRVYIPELGRVCLVEGEVKFPDGSVETGKYVFDPETKKMKLVESGTTQGR